MSDLPELTTIAATRITRRNALVGTGAAAGLVALSACGSSSSAAATTAAAAPATTATAAAATTAAAASLVSLDKVPVGGSVAATDADGKPIVVAQPTAGTVVAFTAICTHMGCTVAPAGKELHCPCHGSKYDAMTGKVLNGPAPDPLAPVAVHVAGGQVVAG